MKPEWVVVSAGFENSYGHPHRDVITRVESHAIAMTPHTFRWSWIENKLRKYKNFTTYSEAIFASSKSGTIDLFPDGTVHPVLKTEK